MMFMSNSSTVDFPQRLFKSSLPLSGAPTSRKTIVLPLHSACAAVWSLLKKSCPFSVFILCHGKYITEYEVIAGVTSRSHNCHSGFFFFKQSAKDDDQKNVDSSVVLDGLGVILLHDVSVACSSSSSSSSFLLFGNGYD